MSREIQAPKNIYSEGLGVTTWIYTPHLITVNTRIITFLVENVENPYQPSFATVGW